MAQISVMMAAYNEELYIRRALDSILAQSFQDFDVIVVDDGSTDGTGGICDEYAGRDSRVHVIHQKNAGVCAARNQCLDWIYESSDSSWVIFVDSDDWMHRSMLERMLAAALENHVKICACGYEETTGADPMIQAADLKPVIYKTMDFYQENYVNAIMACCKLYHKDLCRDIRHPVGYDFDDEFVSHQILYKEKKMAVIPAPLYAYFINYTGLTKRPWTPKMLDTWVAYEEQIAFFRERGEEDLVSFRLRGYLENAVVNYRAAQGNPVQKRIRKKIREVLRRMKKQGCLDWRMDQELLLEFYPVAARIVRAGKEIMGK